MARVSSHSEEVVGPGLMLAPDLSFLKCYVFPTITITVEFSKGKPPTESFTIVADVSF